MRQRNALGSGLSVGLGLSILAKWTHILSLSRVKFLVEQEKGPQPDRWSRQSLYREEILNWVNPSTDGSAFGSRAGCHVRPILSSWLGFPASQAFHSFGNWLLPFLGWRKQ